MFVILNARVPDSGNVVQVTVNVQNIISVHRSHNDGSTVVRFNKCLYSHQELRVIESLDEVNQLLAARGVQEDA